MTTNLSRRDGLAIIGGAAAGVFMPAVARAQAAEIQVHYSMPAIFKEAQDAVMAAFQVKHPEVKATYVNPTPTMRMARNCFCATPPPVRCRTCRSRALTGCACSPSAASPST